MDLYPSEPETHLRDYWYVLLKRRWLIAAVAVTILALAAVHTFMQTPRYSATAVVQITRGKINLVEDIMVQDNWTIAFYTTQQRVLKSRTLAHRVVDQLQLWRHPVFGGRDGSDLTPEAREALAMGVQSMLNVSHVQNTQLMEVTFTTPDARLSAELANTLVYQYSSFSTEAETDVARKTTSFIREQIEKLQQEIQHKETLLQEYSQREDIVMVDQKENIVIQQLEGLNASLTQARAQRVEAEARYRSLQSADPGTLAEVANDPAIQGLRNQLAAVQKQYAELASKFKPEWPEMQRTRSALEETERRVREESRLVARKAIAAARVEYQSALKKERMLEEAVEEQKRQAQDLNKITTDYNRIKVELDNQRTMLQQLLRRHSESDLRAELGERQPVNVRVVEEAVVPKRPSQPNLYRSLLLGILLGISLAIGFAFFLEYWDTSIHTIEDLRRYVTLPYLGMVPRYAPESVPLLEGRLSVRMLPGETTHRKSHSSSKDLTRTRQALTLANPTSPPGVDASVIAERFKFLRGSLLLSNPGSPPRTVLVTGPDKNAGKTFVACNLAVSLAELGKRVLIIDADLRNPQVHRIFRFRNRKGLSNVLTGQAEIEQGTIVSTPFPNVFVLLAGPPCPSPAELLGSPQMEQVLATCSEHFDYVLLDSAPLLPVFDTHVLTAKCDASLLVVRSGHTSRYAVKSSLDFVDRVGGRIAGVVLNDVDLTDRAQNYYYTYHTYEYGTYSSRDSGEGHN